MRSPLTCVNKAANETPSIFAPYCTCSSGFLTNERFERRYDMHSA